MELKNPRHDGGMETALWKSGAALWIAGRIPKRGEHLEAARQAIRIERSGADAGGRPVTRLDESAKFGLKGRTRQTVGARQVLAIGE